MKLMQSAMEECSSCQNKQVFSSTDPKAVNQTDATYHNGKGIKDTIMIDGPLGFAITEALNVGLKKKPLQATDEEPNMTDAAQQAIEDKVEGKDPELAKLQNNDSSIGLATESSQQQMEDAQAYLIREFDNNSNETRFLANKFDFVDAKDLPKNVVCSTTVLTVGEFLNPRTLIKYTEDKSQSRIEHVLLVVADALGRSSNTTVKQQLVRAEAPAHFVSDDQSREFSAAVESHVSPAGYKVCLGVEAYLAYLGNLSRELGI